MANCAECGKKFGFVALIREGGLCSECFQKQKDSVQRHRQELVDSAQQEENGASSKGTIDSWEHRKEDESGEHISRVHSVMITTETAINIKVLKRIDIIAATAYCPIDMDVNEFKDDLFYSLKKAAVKIGANAIIGVSLSIVQDASAQFGSGSLNRHRALAVGTAVVTE